MNYCIRIFSFIVSIGLCLLGTTPSWAGTVTGVMQMMDGTPMAGGMVIVFVDDEGPPPQLSEDSREPEFVEDLNNEGAFRINLSAGKYYFGAVQWREGRGPGKPVKGDNFFLMRDEKVLVPSEGSVDLGTVQKGKKIR